MNFDSIEAFLHMGGHGVYVWLSYGVGFLVFITAIISPLIKRKKIYNELLQLQRRKQRTVSTNEDTTSIT